MKTVFPVFVFLSLVVALAGIYHELAAEDADKGATISSSNTADTDVSPAEATPVLAAPPALTTLPADRPRYVLLTDQELARINLPELFAAENPEVYAASGGDGIDYQAYFGLHVCVARSAGGLSKTQRMGWLAPEAFAVKFASQLQGDSGWDRMAKDAPRPEWLKQTETGPRGMARK